MTLDYRFAQTYRNATGSAIRELFKYMSYPDMISFAGGYPSPSLFDQAGLYAAMERTRSAAASDVFQYGATEGRPGLRDAFRELLKGRGISTTVDRLLVTSGSQQGFDMLIRTLIEPGDTVIVTRPAYAAALQALRLAGAHLVTVDTGANGIDCGELERVLSSGVRPKMMYCVPTFDNPSGNAIPLEQRWCLVELAVRYQFILIEDDPYGELRFSGKPLATLTELASEIPGATDWVVYLSSLSKIVAPSLRIGVMLAPLDVLGRCLLVKQVSDLCTSPWMQLVAQNYLESGALKRNLPLFVDAYRERCATMTGMLRSQLGDQLHFTLPQGGMFVWGEWKGNVDAAHIFKRAIAANVMYVPGTSFYAQKPDPRTLRLSFAMSSPQQIVEGVRRLRIAYDRCHESLQ